MKREDREFYSRIAQTGGGLGRGCGPTLMISAIFFIVIACFVGCRTVGRSVAEKEHVSDSVRIEYRERVVRVPVTVYVEVPIERQMQIADDSSHLETSFAVSDASMVWIDGVPFLRHSLENKPQKIEKKDSVPVTEKEKTVWKTRRVTYTRTEIREKKLAWWQKGLMWSGAIGWIFLVIIAVKRRLLRFCSLK